MRSKLCETYPVEGNPAFTLNAIPGRFLLHQATSRHILGSTDHIAISSSLLLAGAGASVRDLPVGVKNA